MVSFRWKINVLGLGILALAAACQASTGGGGGGGTVAGPVCGNGYCENGESTVSCQADCKKSTVCTPNATSDCYDCPANGKGTKKCNSDGSGMGSCVCPKVNLCAGKECGPDGNGGVCGSCGSGKICDINGQCVDTGPGPCSPSSPNGSCPSGESCIQGSCCGNPCGSTCCTAGSICVSDNSGNKVCASECTNSGECPSTKSCCARLVSGKGACLASTFQDGMVCLCNSAYQCEGAGYVCGQEVDMNGIPLGYNACEPADGGPYHGCGAENYCTPGYCCVNTTWKSDGSENSMCVLGCTTSAQCGAATCAMMASGTCNSAPGTCH